ncbi:MAG TPA: polyprenyl synthetase family protein [Actinomycetota bacterium]
MIGPTWLVDDLLRVEALMSERAGESVQPLVAEAATHLINAGGKRLRPALVLLSSRAGEAGRPESDMAAAAVELVHLATLYHDDVIDETDVRRGVPTVHAKWGVEVAVLAGDYLFAVGCILGATAGGDVPKILATALADVCEGQIAETQALNDPNRSVAGYIETIGRKTGALFRASCELGASTSGAGVRERAALRAYGENLGAAFQVVDDVIDLVGDPDVTGKTPGTDVKEGVFTLPVLLACERDPSLRDALASGERDLDKVLPSLQSTGSIRDALVHAESFGDAAADAIRDLPPSEWSDALQTIVGGVLAQVPAGVAD